MDEDVLQARRDFAHRDARALFERSERREDRRALGAAHMQRGSEWRDHLDAGRGAQLERDRHQGLGAVALDGPRIEARLVDHLADGAVREELAVGDVGERVAALGLVHVVRAHEHGDAGVGEIVDMVPEFAACARIHARGGLVEEKQLGLVDEARGECEALLPAARERARELVLARGEAEALESLAQPALAVVDLVHARDEVQILLDGQVVVETELLRHVAHLALDELGVLRDVVAEHDAAPLVGREQPADHADGGGLAAAVGAKEAVDGALRNLHREMVDDGLLAEALGEALDINGVFGAHCSVTSTGCPGCSLMASADDGRASTMKTSFARLSLL